MFSKLFKKKEEKKESFSDISILFDEDLAWDIREEYKDLIAEGKSTEDATEILLDNYKELLTDRYVPDLFWISLAASQWKYGRLIGKVKEQAIKAIDSGRDLERWDDDLKEKRRKTLLKLKEKLLSPQPEPKKIRKPYISTSPFETGDVISYRTNSGKFVLMRVIGVIEHKGGKSIKTEFLDWCGDKIPSEKQINKLKIKVKTYKQTKDTISRFWMGDRSKKDFPKERVELILKNSTPSQKDLLPSMLLYWTDLDRFLEKDIKLV